MATKRRRDLSVETEAGHVLPRRVSPRKTRSSHATSDVDAAEVPTPVTALAASASSLSMTSPQHQTSQRRKKMKVKKPGFLRRLLSAVSSVFGRSASRRTGVMDVEDDEEEAKVESKAAGPKSESVATSASSVATGGPSGSATGLAPSAQAWTIAMDTPSGPDATAVTRSDGNATSDASQTRVQTSEARSASGEAASSLAVAGSLPPRKASAGGAGVGANPRKLAIHDLALDEEDTRAAELAAALEQGRSLFGDSVAKLGSEVWQERRDALDTLCVQLQGLSQRRAAGDASASEVDVNMLFDVACHLLYKPLEDAVGPVYFAACSALHALLDEHLESTAPLRVRRPLGLLMPQLLAKMAATNSRTRREAAKCVLQVARAKTHGGASIVAPYLLNDRYPLRARLSVLRLLVPETRGARSSGLTFAAVMGVAVPALQVADEKTRKSAIAVVVAVHNVAGDRTLKHLTGVKPATLKILQHKFEEAKGGTPVKEGGEPTAPSPMRGSARKLAPLRHGSGAVLTPGKQGSLPRLGAATPTKAPLPPALPQVAPGPPSGMSSRASTAQSLESGAGLGEVNPGSGRVQEVATPSAGVLDDDDEAMMAAILDA